MHASVEYVRSAPSLHSLLFLGAAVYMYVILVLIQLRGPMCQAQHDEKQEARPMARISPT
jgi:hypothetical protein